MILVDSDDDDDDYDYKDDVVKNEKINYFSIELNWIQLYIKFIETSLFLWIFLDAYLVC